MGESRKPSPERGQLAEVRRVDWDEPCEWERGDGECPVSLKDGAKARM